MDRIFHPSTERIPSKREPSLGYRAYRTGGSLDLTPAIRKKTTRSGDGKTRTVAEAFRQVEKAQDTASKKISSSHIEFEGTASTVQNKIKGINTKIESQIEEEVYKIFGSLNYKEKCEPMNYVTKRGNIIHGNSLKDILLANESDFDYLKRYYTRGKIASSKAEQYKWIPRGRIFNLVQARDLSYSCHSYTFTEGKAGHIAGTEVQTILDDNGYHKVDLDKFKCFKNPKDGVKRGDIVVYRNEAGVIIHTGVVSDFETYLETRENGKVVKFTVPLVRSKMSIPGAVYDLSIDLTGSAFGKSCYGRPYQKSKGGFEIYSGGSPLQPEISAPPP